jgi:hypothetical protein
VSKIQLSITLMDGTPLVDMPNPNIFISVGDYLQVNGDEFKVNSRNIVFSEEGHIDTIQILVETTS